MCAAGGPLRHSRPLAGLRCPASGHLGPASGACPGEPR
ncbi:hypothetical protein Rrhod_0663 [Rhodococcus rhodnii LMG 5362]|uniref:Uncharacterized protein n=1 Tax=Rhodococcus rhodnii LMG 5362 TaxID=1273125 RepID=R7WV21_9NOCA|nr:hypothetical protein Rrhod_0663 [Rhodococcus rhodnii LMG 5362]